MQISSLGDLANSYQLRRDTARIRTDLTRLTQELSSGVTSNLASKLKGDFGHLAGIERGIERAESYRAIIAENAVLVSAQQNAVEKLRGFGEIADTFFTLPETADATLIRNAGAEALSTFEAALNTFNIQVGGRSVFSGTETSNPALADIETVMTALETEIAAAGATTAADVELVVSAWFVSGGGFDTIGYLGGAQQSVGVQLSDMEVAPRPITAADDAIRDQLSALSLGALLGRNVLAGNLAEQGSLARLSAERLIGSNDGLVALQASLGVVEAQNERASVEVSTERDALKFARSELIEADPFDVAVQLQQAETQLETIYTVTARLSRLSLTEFL